MVNYKFGKIYVLTSEQTEDIYIGSTSEKLLSSRLSKHNWHYNNKIGNKSAYKILKFDDCKIELLENYPCESIDELTAREGFYIREYECVNQNIAGRTRKQWAKDNPQRISTYNKDYRAKHLKEKINCECGCVIAKSSIQKHLISFKHHDLIEKNKCVAISLKG